MVKLYERKKRGEGEREALEWMVKDERGRVRWMLRMIEEGESEGPSVEDIRKVFGMFVDKEEIEEGEIKWKVLRFLIEKNILFYNPVEGKVRPQSRLLHRAISELMNL